MSGVQLLFADGEKNVFGNPPLCGKSLLRLFQGDDCEIFEAPITRGLVCLKLVIKKW